MSAARPPRVLLCTRRRVPAPRRADYDAAWGALQRAATGLGGHAWRFVAAPDDSSFLEFLEFAAGSDPRADSGFLGLLSSLDGAFGPGAAEEWHEA